MLLVNNPGSWASIYEPLEHAPWFGWTPTDLIFPFFLFIVGVTTHLSREARRARGESDGTIIRQTARRALTIIALGLLMTGFPYHQFFVHLPGGAVFDSTTTPLDASHWRFTGVLQRIGVCYLLGALLTLRTIRPAADLDRGGAAHRLLARAHAHSRSGARHGRAAPLRSGRIARGVRSIARSSVRATCGSVAAASGTPREFSRASPPQPPSSSACSPADGSPSQRPLQERLTGLFAAGLARDDGGARVGVVLSHWEESVDQLLRRVHRGNGVRCDRDLRVARGRTRLARLDQAVHSVRDSIRSSPSLPQACSRASSTR